VFAAIRPNARSLSVHQGKGLDEASARASAFMEAVEFDHAERVEARSSVFSRDSAPPRVAFAHPDLLPRARNLRRDRPIEWIEGRDFTTGKPIFVPRALVSVDFTGHANSPFIESTSGLASGNSFAEAALSGMLELIERDACALWRQRSSRQKAQRRLALGSVPRGKARSLIARLHDADMSIAVWDATTDVDIASFVCRIRENTGNTRSAFGAFWGAGCHLSRDVAFCRAVTEAVQTRLTYISGARDDILRRDYAETQHDGLRDLVVDIWEQREGGRSFRNLPDSATPTIDGDVALTIARLKAAGLDQVIAVDLTRDKIGIPVARMIVPGLEPDQSHHSVRLGKRAKAVAREQEML